MACVAACTSLLHVFASLVRAISLLLCISGSLVCLKLTSNKHCLCTVALCTFGTQCLLLKNVVPTLYANMSCSTNHVRTEASTLQCFHFKLQQSDGFVYTYKCISIHQEVKSKSYFALWMASGSSLRYAKWSAQSYDISYGYTLVFAQFIHVPCFLCS